MSVKNIGILIRIALNIQIALGSVDMLAVLIPLPWDIFPLITVFLSFFYKCFLIFSVQNFHTIGVFKKFFFNFISNPDSSKSRHP